MKLHLIKLFLVSILFFGCKVNKPDNCEIYLKAITQLEKEGFLAYELKDYVILENLRPFEFESIGSEIPFCCITSEERTLWLEQHNLTEERFSQLSAKVPSIDFEIMNCLINVTIERSKTIIQVSEIHHSFFFLSIYTSCPAYNSVYDG